MTDEPDPTLAELVDRIAERVDAGEGVSVSTIQQIAGKRFAGPLLFFPAMIVVSPLSLIPTLPTLTAITVVIVAAQLLAGARTIWLPSRIRAASLSPERSKKVIDFLRPWLLRIGKLTKPRLTFLVDGIGTRLAALAAILVAATMPPLEFFPGASTSAGLVIGALGLAITTRDGALLLAAISIPVVLAVAIFLIFF